MTFARAAMSLTKLLFLVLLVTNHFDGGVSGPRSARSRLLPHSYEASVRFIGRHFCAGAIVGRRHILTAAHCFYHNGERYPEPMFKYMSVAVGFNGNLFEGGRGHKIKSVTMHEDLMAEINDFWGSDIAVVTLESEVSYSRLVQPIDLPVANLTETARARTSIWSSPVDEMQSVEVYLLPHERCLHQLKEKYLGQYYSKVCGYTTSKRNLCLTLDGSPLVQNDRLVGIGSSSTGCRNGQPDVYTNVFRSLKFIRRVVQPSYNYSPLHRDFPRLEDMYARNATRDRSVVQTSY